MQFKIGLSVHDTCHNKLLSTYIQQEYIFSNIVYYFTTDSPMNNLVLFYSTNYIFIKNSNFKINKQVNLHQAKDQH